MFKKQNCTLLTDEKSRKTTIPAATPRRRADPTAVAAVVSNREDELR